MSVNTNGYNPIRWNCEKDGCFNIKRRPKIEQFADCFPGRINFGDIDGLVEMNHKGLFLEWKGYVGSLPKGQQITHERLTADGRLSTLCVVGDAETMECTHYGFFFKGKWHDYKEASLEDIKQFIKRWVAHSKKAS